MGGVHASTWSSRQYVPIGEGSVTADVILSESFLATLHSEHSHRRQSRMQL